VREVIYAVYHAFQTGLHAALYLSAGLVIAAGDPRSGDPALTRATHAARAAPGLAETLGTAGTGHHGDLPVPACRGPDTARDRQPVATARAARPQAAGLGYGRPKVPGHMGRWPHTPGRAADWYRQRSIRLSD
jgi:hypothetical protein